MPALNWGLIQDGGVFESLMHAILYAENSATVLFGRPGKDAGQDARSADGALVYQAKFRQGLDMDGAIGLALQELDKIKEYRKPTHPNITHWQHARRWVLVANFSVNPNDHSKWQERVVPAFHQEGIEADYWQLEVLEGKLAQHPEVADVFFGGKIRVLVGLKEAYDLLRNAGLGGESMDAPLVGRDDELSLIQSFADGEKRVLPIIGPGGIGKSRLLYEALVSLGQDGWRVLWGLPESMRQSSEWFWLLSGNQQTCVALDDPELLPAVIEQLHASERRNWRVVVACRSEMEEALRRFRRHSLVQDPVLLRPLDEETSNALVNQCLGGHANPAWLHSVYIATRGIPGWLCLVAEMAKRNALSDPTSADEIADCYVNSCLQMVGGSQTEQVRKLLRWLALWGTLCIEPEKTECNELPFLETEGLPVGTTLDLLKKLVDAGIVHNWGVRKRLYAVEPLIIRQQILSNWLFREINGSYHVSDAGGILVSQLVRGAVPALDSALANLSQLAISRLAEPEVIRFLDPVFQELERISREGTLIEQYHVADLVEKAGHANPENALDVLAAIRLHAKEDIIVEPPLWGPQSLTHSALVAKLPWILYQMAQDVFEPIVARRYLNEFRQYIALEDADTLDAEPGKKPHELLGRLLCGSKNAELFAQPAYEAAIAQLTAPDRFVRRLLRCLLNPVRERVEWVSKWQVSFATRPIRPDGDEWRMAMDVREKAFAALRTNPATAFRVPLWRELAEAHHATHRAVTHGYVTGAAVTAYRRVIVDDLTKCAAILQSPPVPLTIEEATHARGMWSWYLEYGRDDDPVELARQCEEIYRRLSKWRVHDFFRFATSAELAPETERVAGLLRAATDRHDFLEFFDEANRYLDSARPGSQDLADGMRISELATACADVFAPDAAARPQSNALTEFVVTLLRNPEDANRLAWGFAISVCRRHLLTVKSSVDADVAGGLTCLLEVAGNKSGLLWGIYSNPHPLTTGTLTKAELDCVMAHGEGFSQSQWFSLLGAFWSVDDVRRHVRDRLVLLRDELVQASDCMARFIDSLHWAALRYESAPAQLPVAWIIAVVSEFRLDGRILGMHELDSLRQQASFQLDMVQFANLIRSRIQLELGSRPGSPFEVMPFRFAASQWCKFDSAREEEVTAFRELCQLALGRGSFMVAYSLPKYLAWIDPSGQATGAFVDEYLSNHPNIEGIELARLGYLAAEYPDSSGAWAHIAHPICARALTMRREDREHVYFGLSRKETPVLSSGVGEVPQYWVDNLDRAARLRNDEPPDSPIRGYREWALHIAELELQREKERVEEDTHE